MSKTCESGDASAIYVSVSELRPTHLLFPQLQELRQFYETQFGTQPEFFVRVPGRVNIIGEHVDYCGYPVLPMATEQCILLAVGVNASDSILHLRNVNTEKFENFKCELSALSISLPAKGGPEWYKYYLCGVKGIYELLTESTRPLRQPIGMSVALSGNIPPAAGLSSSSALVSAAVLATAHVHGLPLERKRLASISASCERYIGTQGGGMDQAIAYLAKAGCAQFIEFQPSLQATPVQLPVGACFVVANSLAEKNKAASSDFNERVVECRLSARIIAKRMALSDWRQIVRLAQLQEALNCSLTQLEALAVDCLAEVSYTRADVCKELQVDPLEFEQEFLTPNTRHMDKFKLQQRTLHVIQESQRVRQFRAICEQTRHTEFSNGTNCTNGTNGTSDNDNKSTDTLACNGAVGDAAPNSAKQLHTLAQLMRQSHHSLMHMYECSHPDLDRIIALSDALGVGARLTGAGWGGCVVALCDSIESTNKYIAELKYKYYEQLPAHMLEKHRHNDFRDLIFATYPCQGAEIFKAVNGIGLGE